MIDKEALVTIVQEHISDALDQCEWPLQCRIMEHDDFEEVVIALFGNNNPIREQSRDDLARVGTLYEDEIREIVQEALNSLKHDDNSHTLVKGYVRRRSDGTRSWVALEGWRYCNPCETFTKNF